MAETYEDLLRLILATGESKQDRTKVGTLSLFGLRLQHDLSTGFPLVTTKKVHFRSVVAELLWFLNGDTNVEWLNDRGVTIWNEWADHEGNLGPIYGKQWRSWSTPNGSAIDQMSWLIREIKANSSSRRLVVSAWNVGEIEDMALPPCHILMQFNVSYGKLSCQVYQRSADMFLGVPFNLASYALLTHMVAEQCRLDVGDLIWVGGDCHIYLNHLEQVGMQVMRHPFPFPELVIDRPGTTLFNYDMEHIRVAGYQHHGRLRGSVAV